MKLSRLIKESRLFWPKTVITSDAIESGNNGIRFPTLISAQEKAEAEQEKINHWHELVNWAIYVAYHTLAKESYLSGGKMEVNFDDIDRRLVASHIRSTLSNSYHNWPRNIRRGIKLDV